MIGYLSMLTYEVVIPSERPLLARVEGPCVPLRWARLFTVLLTISIAVQLWAQAEPSTTPASVAANVAATEDAAETASLPEREHAAPGHILCGKRDDGKPHLPPDYNSFLPPDRTQSYVDPAFGCRIRRLTNGPADFGVAVHHEYSVPFPFNADDSKILLVRNDGMWMVTDLEGTVVIPPNPPPDGFEFTTPAAEPRWDKRNPNLIWYHVNGSNQLKTVDISSGKPVIRLVHNFKSCKQISFGSGETNISEDGDHITVVCQNGKQQSAGVYTMSRDHYGPTVDITGHKWDWFDMTPDNNVLARWVTPTSPERFHGIELFDGNMKFLRQIVPYGSHSARGRDLNGDEVLIISSAPDKLSACGHDGAGVQKVRLSDGKKTCLLAQHWWGEVGHLSVSQNGWVLVTITDDNTPTTSAYTLPSDWKQRWKPYMNEIILVRIDGSQVIRLAHTRTRERTDQNEYAYWAVPRGALSRDGRYALFDSNFGLHAKVQDYSDVYLIKLQ